MLSYTVLYCMYSYILYTPSIFYYMQNSLYIYYVEKVYIFKCFY